MISGDRQIGLRLEGVIEAPFIHAGPLANIVDTNRSVAVLPDQLDSGAQQLLPGITFSSHAANLVDWLVQCKSNLSERGG